MAVVAVISIPGLSAEQYDAIIARMDVVARPSPEIYVHPPLHFLFAPRLNAIPRVPLA